MTNLLMCAAALAVIALFEGLYYLFRFVAQRKGEEMRRRLQATGRGEGGARTLLRRGRLSGVPIVDGFLSGLPQLQQLADLMDQVHATGTVARHLMVSGMAALGAAVLGLLVGGIGGAMTLGTAAAFVPTLGLLIARERRSAKLSAQLPSALDMMVRSLRAGHSLPAAFKLVSTEMPAPISVEFARAHDEQNLGMEFEKAVLQMAARAPRNRDMKIFAVSVIIQKETGGNVVEILEKLAETIRSRYQFYGKLAALSAEGKISGLVLGALPIVTALALVFLNNAYVSALVTAPMGRRVLGYAVLSWALGILWLRQMGKVEL